VASEKAPDKETWVSVRLTESIRVAIGRIASKENRNVSAQIRQFIVEGIEHREGVPDELSAKAKR